MANTPSAPRRSWPGWRRWPNTGTKIQHRSCGVGSVGGDENASANADIGREARVPTAASPCEDAGRPVMATHMTSDPLDEDLVDEEPTTTMVPSRFNAALSAGLQMVACCLRRRLPGSCFL